MATIKRKKLLILAGAAYLLAWPLPTFIETFPIGPFFSPTPVIVRGWEATRWALSPVWPLDWGGFDVGPFHAAVIVASGLANLVFIGALLLALRWPERVTRGVEYATWIAALAAAHWLVLLPGHWQTLRIGYYLWVTSFVLLALGVRGVRRSRLRGSTTRPST